jgi:hypothetical protein
MRIAMALLAASVALGSVACKKKDDKGGSAAQGSAQKESAPTEPSPTPAPEEAPGSGSDPAAEPGAAGDTQQMAKRAGNCPSTVASSTTTAKREGDKIVLTVTSTDADAVAAIQKRTEALLAQKAAGTPAGAAHDQKGTHGGSAGLCPVHLGDGGTATWKPSEQGVVIEITPKGDAAALETEIQGRIQKAAEWVNENIKAGPEGTTGGVGGGAGKHGSNHSGHGDGKGSERRGDGTGGGKGTGGGGGAGTGGGGQHGGSAAN